MEFEAKRLFAQGILNTLERTNVYVLTPIADEEGINYYLHLGSQYTPKEVKDKYLKRPVSLELANDEYSPTVPYRIVSIELII